MCERIANIISIMLSNSTTEDMNESMNEVSNEQQPICTLRIPVDDWNSLVARHVIFERRQNQIIPKLFRTSFNNYLSLIAQNNGISCWLNCHRNWFRVTDSTWSGTYTCTVHSCPAKYKLITNKVAPFFCFLCFLTFF